MAGSLNRAQLIGHLGSDPEVKRLQNGNSVVNLRVATSDSWRDRNSGDRKEKTEWHTVVIWNEGLQGVAEKYLKKGSKVFIEGKIETRQWEKDGEKRYSTEIVLNNFGAQLIMLGGKDDEDGGGRRNGGGGRDRDDRDRGRDDRDRNSRDYGRESGGSSSRRQVDDEIPF